ncbi:5491_t:CDS:2, partial [Acaulospora colombiana]
YIEEDTCESQIYATVLGPFSCNPPTSELGKSPLVSTAAVHSKEIHILATLIHIITKMAFIDNTMTVGGVTLAREEEHRRLIDMQWRCMSEIKQLRDHESSFGTEEYRILQEKIAAYNEV